MRAVCSLTKYKVFLFPRQAMLVWSKCNLRWYSVVGKGKLEIPEIFDLKKLWVPAKFIYSILQLVFVAKFWGKKKTVFAFVGCNTSHKNLKITFVQFWTFTSDLSNILYSCICTHGYFFYGYIQYITLWNYIC